MYFYVQEFSTYTTYTGPTHAWFTIGDQYDNIEDAKRLISDLRGADQNPSEEDYRIVAYFTPMDTDKNYTDRLMN